MMKRDYSVTSLAGALVWAAAMILRRLSLLESGIIGQLINALPKFGVVWLVVGLTVTFWPQLFKKPFPANRMYLLIALSLAPFVLYKICLPLVRGVPMSITVWDVAATLAAAAWLAVEHLASSKASPDEKADEVAATPKAEAPEALEAVEEVVAVEAVVDEVPATEAVAVEQGIALEE